VSIPTIKLTPSRWHTWRASQPSYAGPSYAGSSDVVTIGGILVGQVLVLQIVAHLLSPFKKNWTCSLHLEAVAVSVATASSNHPHSGKVN
jgi:hypothetical protein